MNIRMYDIHFLFDLLTSSIRFDSKPLRTDSDKIVETRWILLYEDSINVVDYDLMRAFDTNKNNTQTIP